MKATVNNATAFEVSSNINSKTVVLNNQSLPLDLLQNGAHLHFVWKGKSVNVDVLSLSKEEKKVAAQRPMTRAIQQTRALKRRGMR